MNTELQCELHSGKIVKLIYNFHNNHYQSQFYWTYTFTFVPIHIRVEAGKQRQDLIYDQNFRYYPVYMRSMMESMIYLPSEPFTSSNGLVRFMMVCCVGMTGCGCGGVIASLSISGLFGTLS